MDELVDAIEDAQYVDEITNIEELKPVTPWEVPTESQLEEWKGTRIAKEADAGGSGAAVFGYEWTLGSALGLFLFSAHLKNDENDNYTQINFMEEVIRWRGLRGKQRALKAKRIVEKYILRPVDPKTGLPTAVRPEKTQICEHDLERPCPPWRPSPEELKELVKKNWNASLSSSSSSNVCCIGLDGPIRDDILAEIQRRITAQAEAKGEKLAASTAATTPTTSETSNGSDALSSLDGSTPEVREPKMPLSSSTFYRLPDDFFDMAEIVVAEVVRRRHWDSFLQSEDYRKFLHFLWYQDRKVVEEDFFLMRVLGRGGFGQVTACKKGTTGKLYAMKVMSKKRIKMKKSEQLTLNERAALAAVDSPFVVNLKYSFQSKDDIFLILDLMSGGDLSFHLGQRGPFGKAQCLYYTARIMLGLQALHDQQYVYRDLKPENCLLAKDGRVKITDLGLATKITPTLHGAAGTRGYWAPEMLRRDKKGKRMPYGHSVDWFSFGCVVAEFISGINPFRSENALNFGFEHGKTTKEKALDCATLEMDPELDVQIFGKDAADLCAKLLDKNEKRRLGANGCEDIMTHPYFRDVDWEMIITDRQVPPFEPPQDVNAASQSEIGTFEHRTFHDTVLEERDEEIYRDWDWTNPRAFAAEVIEFLIYERQTGHPLIPMQNQSSCCCAVM